MSSETLSDDSQLLPVDYYQATNQNNQ